MNGELLLISDNKKNKKTSAEPLYTFVVLLNNDKTITQTASAWHETTGEEGEGIAYNFYVQKTRVMTIEYTEVRAVFCKEHCNVEEAISAMVAKEKPEASARKAKQNGTRNK